jgi:hypothetical protein
VATSSRAHVLRLHLAGPPDLAPGYLGRRRQGGRAARAPRRAPRGWQRRRSDLVSIEMLPGFAIPPTSPSTAAAPPRAKISSAIPPVRQRGEQWQPGKAVRETATGVLSPRHLPRQAVWVPHVRPCPRPAQEHQRAPLGSDSLASLSPTSSSRSASPTNATRPPSWSSGSKSTAPATVIPLASGPC